MYGSLMADKSLFFGFGGNSYDAKGTKKAHLTWEDTETLFTIYQCAREKPQQNNKWTRAFLGPEHTYHGNQSTKHCEGENN